MCDREVFYLPVDRTDRWVTYLFDYYDGIKGQNIGFIKTRKCFAEDEYEAELDIGIKMYSECNGLDLGIYLVRESSDGLRRELVDETRVRCNKNDLLSMRYRIPWNSPFEENIDFPGYDGVVICSEKRIYAGFWSYCPFDDRKWGLAGKKESVVKENTFDTEDGLEYILENHESLPLFIESPIIKGVKIRPKDIGRLDMCNWHLGQNSFLAHGYYKYKYLMLGKVSIDSTEKCVIGVPGVYTNKEKYLANMFGFGRFVPVKKCKYLTGNFGYWILEVTSE